MNACQHICWAGCSYNERGALFVLTAVTSKEGHLQQSAAFGDSMASLADTEKSQRACDLWGQANATRKPKELL